MAGVSSSPGGDAWVNEGQYIQVFDNISCYWLHYEILTVLFSNNPNEVIGQPNGEDGERYVECKTLRDLTSSRST